MNVICMACPPGTEIAEKNYPNHMQIIHGTTSAGEAMAKKKLQEQNIPANVPVESLPSPEFMEVANAIDNPEPPLHVPSTPYLTAKTPEEIKPAAFMQNLNGNMDAAMAHPREGVQPTPTPKPLVLQYKYSGDCPTCNGPVKTIMVDITKRLFAICYCPTEDKEIKQVEVHPLYDTPSFPTTPDYNDHATHVQLYAEHLAQLDNGNSNSTKNVRRAKAVRTMPQAKQKAVSDHA